MSFELDLSKVAVSLYEHLNTPRSLTTEIMARYKEWDQLVTLRLDPRNYLDTTSGAEKFRRDAQATDFLRKSPLVPLRGIDPRKAAESTFEECEAQCKMTNEFLELLRILPEKDHIPLTKRLVQSLDKAHKLAKRILGPVPDDLMGRFGPGTSAELKGSTYATVADKLWITPRATPSCLVLFEHDYWRTLWGRTRMGLGLPLPGVIRGNRFSTVKKDATKHRGICIEPLGNLWVQLAVGGYFKRRLANVGLHVGRSKAPACPLQRLSTRQPFDGQHHHKAMAREGSVSGRWATIDLSNASDTVALELVRWVLPPDWFEFLMACRSPYTWMPDNRQKDGGHWVRLEKFSSMGNGFTFELETLIFGVLIAALTGLKLGQELFVYGDDILLPEANGLDALAILRACGFTPNDRKSFIEGPFRESCGGDYFNGLDVRSCFADSEFETPLDWFVLHNQIRERFPSFGKVLHRIVQRVPYKYRIYGPTYLGDTVLHGTWQRKYIGSLHPETGKWDKKLGSDGIARLATLHAIPHRVPLDRWGTEFALCTMVLGSAVSGSGEWDYLLPRSPPDGFRFGWASVS